MNLSRIKAGIEIDAVCDDFEEDWLPSNRPDFDSYLLRVDEPLRPRLLIQLVRVDLALRSQAQQTIHREDYQSLGPDAVSIAQQHIDLSNRNTQRSPLENQDNGQRKIKKPSVRGFQFIELVSEGGMGSVWRARQIEPVKRDVAVKFIKSGIDSEQVVKRFRAEQQALARMEHENIAKVLDAGTTHENSPYFVMEFVDGSSITEYCNHHQLTLEQRLELFVPVCEAVQHAHQKGVIHRDLKPSNVMITLRDGKPQIKIIDFGLAKAIADHEALTSQSMQTQIGQILGTLQYMSPEQARAGNAEIDTRTDVYSLGVILYELLTDSTPLDVESLAGKDIFEISQRIQTQDPKAPSSRIREVSVDALQSLSSERSINANQLFDAVRGELDWIVLKAIDLDRERRYESPRSLSKDIQRFLDSEPIEAAPPSSTYRLQKFIRRHRIFVSVATCFIFLLLLLLAVTAAGFVMVSQRAERERIAKNDAKQANEVANLRLQQLDQVSDTLVQLVEVAVTRSISEISPADTRREDPFSPHALNALQTVLQTQQESFGENSIDALNTMELLAKIHWFSGEYDKAIAEFERLLPVYRSTFGKHHSETLSIINGLAASYSSAGKSHVATEFYESALVVAEELPNDDQNALSLLGNLAVHFARNNQLKEALRIEKKLYASYLEQKGCDNEATIRSMVNLVTTYSDLQMYEEAKPVAVSAFENAIKHLGITSVTTRNATNNLAMIYRLTNDPENYVGTWNRLFELQKEKLGVSSETTIITGKDLAMKYLNLKDYKGALDVIQEVFEASRDHLGISHPTTKDILRRTAFLNLRLERFDDAIKWLQISLDAWQKDDPDNWEVHTLNSMVGEAELGLGNYEKAEELIIDAYESLLTKVDEIPAGARFNVIDSVLRRTENLYGQWHRAQPSDGHDQSMKKWQQTRAEWRNSSSGS